MSQYRRLRRLASRPVTEPVPVWLATGTCRRSIGARPLPHRTRMPNRASAVSAIIWFLLLGHSRCRHLILASWILVRVDAPFGILYQRPSVKSCAAAAARAGTAASCAPAYDMFSAQLPPARFPLTPGTQLFVPALAHVPRGRGARRRRRTAGAGVTLEIYLARRRRQGLPGALHADPERMAAGGSTMCTGRKSLTSAIFLVHDPL